MSRFGERFYNDLRDEGYIIGLSMDDSLTIHKIEDGMLRTAKPKVIEERGEWAVQELHDYVLAMNGIWEWETREERMYQSWRDHK